MKNKILKISFIVLLLNTVVICYAQNMPDTYSEYTSGKLEYGLFVPENYDPSKSYPLVMFLHGMGNNHTIWDKAQSEPSFYDWMFDFNKSQAE